jgi:hypothetical protein
MTRENNEIADPSATLQAAYSEWCAFLPTICQRARYFAGLFAAKLLKRFGVPDGIRTRVTAVKGRCPNHWTTGTRSLSGQ